jgi:hypothetical protein
MQQGTRRRQTSTMIEQTESFKQIHDLIYIYLYIVLMQQGTRRRQTSTMVEETESLKQIHDLIYICTLF